MVCFYSVLEVLVVLAVVRLFQIVWMNLMTKETWDWLFDEPHKLPLGMMLSFAVIGLVDGVVNQMTKLIKTIWINLKTKQSGDQILLEKAKSE